MIQDQGFQHGFSSFWCSEVFGMFVACTIFMVGTAVAITVLYHFFRECWDSR